jgi:hypothetical protein
MKKLFVQPGELEEQIKKSFAGLAPKTNNSANQNQDLVEDLDGS